MKSFCKLVSKTIVVSALLLCTARLAPGQETAEGSGYNVGFCLLQSQEDHKLYITELLHFPTKFQPRFKAAFVNYVKEKYGVTLIQDGVGSPTCSVESGDDDGALVRLFTKIRLSRIREQGDTGVVNVDWKPR